MFWAFVILWAILIIGLISHHMKQNIENKYTRALIRGVHNRLAKIERELGIEVQSSDDSAEVEA